MTHPIPVIKTVDDIPNLTPKVLHEVNAALIVVTKKDELNTILEGLKNGRREKFEPHIPGLPLLTNEIGNVIVAVKTFEDDAADCWKVHGHHYTHVYVTETCSPALRDELLSVYRPEKV